jgi:hypothetical protein
VTQTGGRTPPVFSVNYQTADAPGAPGVDGTVPPGRKQLIVKIENIGGGEAKDVSASLQNAPGQEDVRVDVGLFRAEHLAPGKTAAFSFVYNDLFDGRPEPYRFDLSVGERNSEDLAAIRISFEGGGAGAAAGHVAPPLLAVSAPTQVHSSSVRVTGEASSGGGLRDVYVTVQSMTSPRLPKKVFYVASTGGDTRLPFTADVPVEEGSNDLRVTARAADGVATTHPLSVLMTPPIGTE